MQRKSHIRTRPEQEGNRRRKGAPGPGVTAPAPQSEAGPETKSSTPRAAATPDPGSKGPLEMVNTETIADELRAISTGEEGEAVTINEAGVAEAAPSGPVFIDKDQFWHGFRIAHEMPGHFFGLQTLIIAPDQPSARPAADAIYNICERTPSLHFLIKPGSQWLADAGAIAMYVVPMTRALRSEVSAKKAARRKAKGPLAKPGSENHVVQEFHAAPPGEVPADA